MVLVLRLLSRHILLHDQVVEVAARVDRSLLVQTRLLHVVTHLRDELFAHGEKLWPRHLVITVAHITRLV